MTAHIIVFGNEKGGTGKSSAAMHVIAALLGHGLQVGSIDLDLRQGTLSRYIENRTNSERALRSPDHVRVVGEGDGAKAHFEDAFSRLCDAEDVIVIDTPGHDTPLGRLAHRFADTLITPLNDSFIDLDVLARVDGNTLKIISPSHYAESVWEERKQRSLISPGKNVDWIVMRNRLSHLDARNKREMEGLLADLSKRIGCRIVSGFGERVIYRELFLKGLTMMDMKPDELSISHLAARQEVRSLIEAMNLPCLK
jgi:chromosome partitioning protein